MQRVRIDLLSDNEIQNRTCSRFSTTIMLQTFLTFAMCRPNINAFVLQNSSHNLNANSSSTLLKNNSKVGQ